MSPAAFEPATYNETAIQHCIGEPDSRLCLTKVIRDSRSFRQNAHQIVERHIIALESEAFSKTHIALKLKKEKKITHTEEKYILKALVVLSISGKLKNTEMRNMLY